MSQRTRPGLREGSPTRPGRLHSQWVALPGLVSTAAASSPSHPSYWRGFQGGFDLQEALNVGVCSWLLSLQVWSTAQTWTHVKVRGPESC